MRIINVALIILIVASLITTLFLSQGVRAAGDTPILFYDTTAYGLNLYVNGTNEYLLVAQGSTAPYSVWAIGLNSETPILLNSTKYGWRTNPLDAGLLFIEQVGDVLFSLDYLSKTTYTTTHELIRINASTLNIIDRVANITSYDGFYGYKSANISTSEKFFLDDPAQNQRDGSILNQSGLIFALTSPNSTFYSLGQLECDVTFQTSSVYTWGYDYDTNTLIRNCLDNGSRILVETKINNNYGNTSGAGFNYAFNESRYGSESDYLNDAYSPYTYSNKLIFYKGKVYYIGTDSKVYRANIYNSGNLPSISSSLGDLRLGLLETKTWELYKYIDNYDNITFSFVDAYGDTQTLFADKNTTIDSYTDSFVQIILYPYLNYSVNLRIRSNSTTVTLPYTIEAHNPSGTKSTIGYNIEIVDSEYLEAPVIEESIGQLILNTNQQVNLNLNNFVTGYDSVSISYLDDSGLLVDMTGEKGGDGESTTTDYLGTELKSFSTSVSLIFTSTNEEIDYDMELEFCNLYGCVTDDLNVVVDDDLEPSIITTGDTDTIYGLWLSIFPDSRTLSTTEKITYTLVTMLLTIILLMIIAFSNRNSDSGKYLVIAGLVLIVMEIFFFTIIGYISAIILIIISALIGLGVYLRLGGSIAGDN